jgi:hypothetical protein
METLDFDTVFLKKFVELSSFEKEEMKDLFSNEDEFNKMKFTLNSINKTIESKNNNISPSIDVKKRLDLLYTKTYQNKGILWYNSIGTFFIASDKNWYNQNLVRIAAVFVVVLSVYPFLNKSGFDSKVILSKNELEVKNKSIEEIATKENASSPQEEKNDVLEINSEEAQATVLASANTSLFDEMPMLAESNVSASTLSMEFAHPDGIFKEVENSIDNQSVFSVKSNPGFLDLMTATY